MTRRPNIWTLRDLRRLAGRAERHDTVRGVILKARGWPADRLAVITDRGPVELTGLRLVGPWLNEGAIRILDRAIAKYGARAVVAAIVDGDPASAMATGEGGILAVSEDQLGGDESAADGAAGEAGAAANDGCAGETGEGDTGTPMDAGDMEDGEPAADGAGTPTDDASAGGEMSSDPAAAGDEEAGQDGSDRATGSEDAGESARDARGDAQQGKETGGMGSAAASTRHDARAGAPDDGGSEHDADGRGGSAQPPDSDGDAGSPDADQPDAATGTEDGREPSSGAADEGMEETGQSAADGAGTPDADPADGEASGGDESNDAAGDTSETETHAGTRSGEDNDPALRERAAGDGGGKTEARDVREDADSEPTDGGGDSPYGGPAMSEIAAAVLKARGAARLASMEIERLLRNILAPRGRRVPIIDERKLINEIITRRYAVSRARREQGRIRPIVITPDGSGSCDLMIRATLPAVEAIRRTLGHDAVHIVTNANGCPYLDGEDKRELPGWLRELADDHVSDYAYDSRPVKFWRALLASGRIAAIVYIGDGDADHVWQQVDDHRVIAIRERYGDPDIGRCQPVDIRAQDDGDAVAYLREIARQIRGANVQPV